MSQPVSSDLSAPSPPTLRIYTDLFPWIIPHLDLLSIKDLQLTPFRFADILSREDIAKQRENRKWRVEQLLADYYPAATIRSRLCLGYYTLKYTFDFCGEDLFDPMCSAYIVDGSFDGFFGIMRTCCVPCQMARMGNPQELVFHLPSWMGSLESNHGGRSTHSRCRRTAKLDANDICPECWPDAPLTSED